MTERETRLRRDVDDDPAAEEADFQEQRRGVVDDSEPDFDDPRVPDEVDPADAQEQRLVVDYDEDDYR